MKGDFIMDHEFENNVNSNNQSDGNSTYPTNDTSFQELRQEQVQEGFQAASQPQAEEVCRLIAEIL